MSWVLLVKEIKLLRVGNALKSMTVIIISLSDILINKIVVLSNEIAPERSQSGVLHLC